MKKHKLTVQKREITGHHAKKIRKSGLIPATVYGKKIKSVNLTVSLKEFLSVYSQVHETGLVELQLGDQTRPVLIHHLQKDPLTEHILHIEFYQVDLKEKVQTRVPLVQKGESPAVAQKLGVLLTVIDEVEVEALPTDLPENLNLDVSSLKELHNELKVSDIQIPQRVTILTDVNLTVVKVTELVSKQAEAEVAAEEAQKAAEAEKTEEAGAVAPKDETQQTKPAESPQGEVDKQT